MGRDSNIPVKALAHCEPPGPKSWNECFLAPQGFCGILFFQGGKQ